MRSPVRALQLAVLSLASTLVLVSPVNAEQPLSAYQQQIHDEINAGLDGVDASLGEARTKLDAGDASGASGVYNTAVRNYNNHIRRLGQLPTDNASVTTLRERAQSLSAKIKETAEAIKTGGTAKPADKPADQPAKKPAANAPKLGYQQVEKLKNARYYLGEIEPRAARLAELAAGKIDAEAIAESKNLMSFIEQRMKYVNDNLTQLPAEHPDVVAEAKRQSEMLAKISDSQAALAKAAPEADKQMAALGQQLQDDQAMLKSWSDSLGNPQFLFDNRPDDAIAAVGQMPQMRQTLGAMLTRWTARATEKPNDQIAGDMVRQLKYVDGQLTDLEKYAAGQGASLPKAIDADIAKAGELIQTAITEKRPAYFKPDAGIAQWVGYAEQKLKLLKAIDSAAGEAAEKSLVEIREKSAVAQKSLSLEIINGNKKPAERYAGADLEDLRQKVIADWKAAYPNDEIIAVIFNTEGWSRTTRWDWSKGNQAFEKVDFDQIQPKLFYKFDEKHAVEIPVNIYKDYMKNERIAINPWEKEAEPPVTRMYLLENMK